MAMMSATTNGEGSTPDDGPQAGFANTWKRPALGPEMRMLFRVSPAQTAGALAFNYAVIVFAALALESLRSISLVAFVIALLPGFIVIGSRQHALLVLMHDGAHGLLARSRALNNWLSDLFCAWPIFVSTQTYRNAHLAHHRFTNTMDDPDYKFKAGKAEWTFPKSRGGLAALLASVFFGKGALDQFRQLAASKEGVPERQSVSRHFARPLYYIALFGLLIFFGVFHLWAIYWLAPMLTALPMILRIRSLAEHFGLPWANELSSTRNVLASPLEKFLFAPHNVNLHLDHHLYPGVPWHQLPRLNRLLSANHEEALQSAWRNDGYFLGAKTVAADLERRP